MAQTKKKTVSADDGNPMQTLVTTSGPICGRQALRPELRVVWATIFLIISKFVLILVLFLQMGDRCARWSARHGRAAADLPAQRGGARHLLQRHHIAQVGLNQLRDIVCQRRPACSTRFWAVYTL